MSGCEVRAASARTSVDAVSTANPACSKVVASKLHDAFVVNDQDGLHGDLMQARKAKLGPPLRRF